MGHFDLGLQPASLRSIARSLTEMADHLRTRGRVVKNTPDEIGDTWTGAAADSVKPEMTNLGQQMGGAGFAAKLTTASGAFGTLAGHYETANEEIGRLNTRWQTAQDLDDAGERKERETQLEREFDTLRTDLETKTSTCATKVGDTSPVGVTISSTGSSPTIDRSALLTKLTLAGQSTALSTYRSARRDIANGDLPPFAEMTEEERTAFLETHPDLVEQLMKIDPAGLGDDERQFVDDVVALAVPHVDGEDGATDAETVLAALDEDASAADFLSAFTDAGDVSDAMNLLASWSDRHGLDLTTNELVADAHAYQEQFLADTGPRHQEVMTYLGAREHRWRTGETREVGPGQIEQDVFDSSGPFTDTWQERMGSIYADTILQVSDERLGGSWDDLPTEVRDAITDTTAFGDRPGSDFARLAGLLAHAEATPGDRMAVELGTSIGNAMENTKGFSGPPGDQEYGLHPVMGEDAYGDLLGVIARNREATTALLTGEGELPERYDRERFAQNIYSYHWADDGKAASALTDWIDQAYTAGQGSPDFELADRAHAGLVKTLTSVGEDGVFKNLMDTDADQSDSSGQVNPALIRSLGRATEHPHVLEDLAKRVDPDEVSTSTRLMMLLAGDSDARERLAGAVTAYNADVMTRYAEGDYNAEESEERIGNLRGLLDAGLFNEAYERTGDAQQAEEERAEAIRTGIGMITSIIPDPSGSTGAGGTLLSHFVKADNVEPVDPHIDPAWTEDGSHVVLASYESLAARMHTRGEITQTEYEAVIHHDAANPGDHVGAYVELFDRHGIDPLDQIGHEYASRLNSYVASGDDELADLIEHGEMPGPG